MKHDDVVALMKNEKLKMTVVSYDCDHQNVERDNKAMEMGEKIFFVSKPNDKKAIGIDLESDGSPDGDDKILHT